VKGLLAAEILKLRKRWMPRILLLIFLAILGVIFWAVGANQSQRTNLFLPRGWLTTLFLSSTLAPFLWPILAGSWAGNEYSWGTVRLVLSRRPNRTQFVLAGILAIVGAIAFSLLIAMAVSTVFAAVVAILTKHSLVDTTGMDMGFLGVLVKSFLAAWLVLAFYAVLAFAAGTLFRSGAVGIGVGIGITLAELVLRGIFSSLGSSWKDASEHFPSVYTTALPGRVAAEGFKRNFASVASTTPGISESLIALTIYIGVPLLLAIVLVRTRDVTA
jgi:ABC-2 type transport system permease protein